MHTSPLGLNLLSSFCATKSSSPQFQLRKEILKSFVHANEACREDYPKDKRIIYWLPACVASVSVSAQISILSKALALIFARPKHRNLRGNPKETLATQANWLQFMHDYCQGPISRNFPLSYNPSELIFALIFLFLESCGFIVSRALLRLAKQNYNT